MVPRLCLFYADPYISSIYIVNFIITAISVDENFLLPYLQFISIKLGLAYEPCHK